jgi:phosphoglycerate dehydrogenase-like enzyme
MRVRGAGRNADPSEVDALLASSDYVVVATPLTPATRGLIDARRVGLLNAHAVLINIGRGPVVDETALIDALRSRRIHGAALDVFDEEPLPPAHPFWELDNVLVSPHCADHTDDAHDRAFALFLRNLDRFRRGEPLENVVDRDEEY